MGIDITDTVSGAGGGMQDLQSVTTVGNITVDPIYCSGIGLNHTKIAAGVSPYAAKAKDFEIIVDLSAGSVTVILPDIEGQIYSIEIDRTVPGAICTVSVVAGGSINGQASYIMSVGHENTIFQCVKTNYIVLSPSIRMDGGTFGNAAFTGGSFAITHNLGVVPTWATLTPKVQQTASAVFVNGYHMAPSPTILLITLLVPIAVATNIQIAWGAFYKT